MGMNVYQVVNSLAQQDLGLTDVVITDSSDIISLGDYVLSSATSKEKFVDCLVLRIGKTIFDDRSYEPVFKGLVMSEEQYGAVLQQISFDIISAEADQTKLTQGVSVDQWKVNKPIVKQKLYQVDNPNQFHISIQDRWIKQAFTSGSEMDKFISSIFTWVQNSISLYLENIARLSLCNLIAEIANGSREIKLLSTYNALTGSELTKDTCLFNPQFLRYCVKAIKHVSSLFKGMNKGLYNDGSITTFTPINYQKMYVLSSFEGSLETEVTYSAFHEEAVKLNNYEEIAYWQGIKSEDVVKVKRASDDVETTVENVVAVLMDDLAVGAAFADQQVSTTHQNCAGLYYNTYWHFNQLWFNDLSKNAVVFTLN